MPQEGSGLTLGGLINQSPRPRLLVRGFHGHPDLIESIMDLGATSRHIRDLSEVRQEEWDILVTDMQLYESTGLAGARMAMVRAAPHLGIIAALDFGSRVEPGIGVGGLHVCSELQRVNGLPERIHRLTHEQLEPVLMARKTHSYFYVSQNIPTPIQNAQRIDLEPFILTADGRILAGRYKRSPAAEAWLLPDDTPNLVDWVKAALAEWHSLAPERFPGLPDWSRTHAWMTPEERKTSAEIDALNSEREEYFQKSAERERTLQQRLRDAQESGDSNQRSLLTAQGDGLKEAVMRALQQLGFVVVDADLTAKPDEHLEDLRIEDPDAPGWISLGEVKGFTKGAKTEGLLQLGRFTRRYMMESGGVPPSASWYIVNQFLNRDPGTRQPVFHGNGGDVDAFAADNGLIIDTVELFRLIGRVERQEMTTEDARTLLRTSHGRFNHAPKQ